MRKGATCTCTAVDATGHTVPVMEDTLTVVELAHLDQGRARAIAEQLAVWHAAEWGHLYHPEVWNTDVARREFAEQLDAAGGQAPTTYVALAHRDGEEHLVGSVSLVPDDDLAGFEHLGPWLASLYVTPSWRHRGIGRRLIAHLLAQAPAREAGTLYLFTADHASWYGLLGWEWLADTTSGPDDHPVTVMFTATGATEGSEQPPHPVP